MCSHRHRQHVGNDLSSSSSVRVSERGFPKDGVGLINFRTTTLLVLRVYDGGVEFVWETTCLVQFSWGGGHRSLSSVRGRMWFWENKIKETEFFLNPSIPSRFFLFLFSSSSSDQDEQQKAQFPHTHQYILMTLHDSTQKHTHDRQNERENKTQNKKIYTIHNRILSRKIGVSRIFGFCFDFPPTWDLSLFWPKPA